MSWSVDKEGKGPSSGSGGISANPNDILVFGYGCKLFRDDDKAAWIDREEHLIPWMGDPALKIDRYDGRGALMDLRPFGPHPQPHGFDGTSSENPELDKLLDDERYKDLREDSEYDDLDYQEVEFRKFQSDVNGVVSQGQYAAIGYCYNELPTDSEAIYPSPRRIDEDLPYRKPEGLTIPDDVVLPTTIKLHAIIEKTAKFIAEHGNQMEIILKTKQSGNALFDFMGYNDKLNPYYKFLVQAIRSNAYKPSDEIPEVEDEALPEVGDCSGSEDESSYLHPSLFRTTCKDPASSIPMITYAPSTGPTAYSMLVSKIKASNPDPVPVESYSYYYNNQNQIQSSMPYSQDWPASSEQLEIPVDAHVSYSRPQNQVPMQQDQLVIEKMASYVVKNGPAFEELARTKGDSRFVFLQPTHEYHWYYLNCKQRFIAETSAVVAKGSFVSYSDKNVASTSTSASSSCNTPSDVKPSTTPRKFTVSATSKPSINLQSVSLPLSASGIPIANLASISSRPLTIPPEVASRIEEIKKKNTLFAKHDLFESLPNEIKKEKGKIQFSSSICKNMPIGSENTTGEGEDSKIAFTEENLEAHTDTEIENTNFDAFDSVFAQPSLNLKSSSDIKLTTPSVDNYTEEDERKRKRSSDSVGIQEGDAEKKRKEERRRKAALFLENLKIHESSTIKDSSKEALLSKHTQLFNGQVINGNEQDRGVEVEPVAKVEEEALKASDFNKVDTTLPILIPETDKSKKNGESSSESHRSRTHCRSRSRSCSPHTYKRPLSVHSNSSDESSSPKKKHSKRKRSKKKKKKSSKQRSSRSPSRSKKSKRHKH